MRRLASAAVLMALLMPVVVRAQSRDDEGKLEEGDYAPDIEATEWLNVEGEPPSLVELRGMVIVLFHFVSFNDAADILLPFVNLVDNHFAFGKNAGVMVIGVTSAERKLVQSELVRNKVRFPVAVESKLAEEYGREDQNFFVIIDAEGKIAFVGPPGSINQLADKLVETLNKTPPTRTHPLEARVARAKIREARRYLSRQEYRQAFLAARDAFEKALFGDTLKDEAFAFIDILETLGYDQLARVRPLLEEEKYREAGRILRRVARQFRGLDAGKDARKWFERLSEENEDFKAAAGTLEDDVKAAKMLIRAVKDIRNRRFGPGYELLEKILTEYPESEAAEYARGIRDRMKANPAVWAKVREHLAASDCRTWLAQARTYIRTGRIREARDLLNRVLDEYGDTSYARQAKELLVSLP